MSRSRGGERGLVQVRPTYCQSRRSLTVVPAGCLLCRRRKVKCDERRENGCANCERLDLHCPGYGNTSMSPQSAASGTPNLTEAGTKRQRTIQSCERCRTSKTRCSGERPSCARCYQKKVRCIYNDKATSKQAMHVESPNLIMTKQSTSTLSEQANVHAASQPMQISAEERSDALAWSVRVMRILWPC